MRVQAKTAYGEVVPIDIQGDDTLETLKDNLHSATHIPKELLKIIFKGKTLHGGKVYDTGLQDGDSIIVLQGRTKPPAPPPDLSREPDAASIRAAIARSRGVDVKVLEEEEEEEEADEPEVKNHLQELVNSLFGNLGFTGLPPAVPAAPVANVEPPPEAIAQLTEMGFSEAQARRALIRNRMSVPQATDWLLEHGDEEEPAGGEPAASAPPTGTGPAVVGGGGQVPTTIVPPAMGAARAEQRLLEMGFPSEEVSRALRESGGNYEAACAILLGERDDDEGALDEDSPIVRAIFSNPIVGAGLSNPRVMQAFRAMVEDPTTVSNYINDPEVGPLILQVHAILQGLMPGSRSAAPTNPSNPSTP